MDFGSAITTEGLLEKQSPNVFKLYQSRYFAIRGKGEYLVWFKKKPVNPDKDPQASGVNLKDDEDEEMYTTTQELLEEINGPKPQKPKQDEKKKKKYDSSSDEQQQKQEKNVEKKKDMSKRLRINTLFEFEAQTKQLKHTYNLIDIVSFEMKSNEQPFELKITYQEVINEEEEEIKENQIILTNVFLIEIKKLYNAIKTVNEKYNMQKQRQAKNANKSKRYPAKRWKYLSEDSWRAPEQKASLYVLLNRKMMRINMLTINLQQITSNRKQSIVIAVASTNNEDGVNKQKQKKQDILRIKYKKQKQEIQIYIQFDKVETMTKFTKKLGKNIKKIQEEIQNENNAKVFVKKEEEKQQGTNQDTYFIDKKIRQTHGSIKLNFYEMMDREVVLQKKQEDPNKNNGFFSKFKAMLCAAQIGMINDASS